MATGTHRDVCIRGDLDATHGDIDTSGDVLIAGSVSGGLTIRAGGNVEVQGHIDGTQILARGNVSIGGRLDGGRVRAGGCLTVGGEPATRIVDGGEAFAVGGVELRGDVGPSSTTPATIGLLADPETTARLDKAEESLASISNLTFSIEAGQSVALVGPSGSGKSTVLDLLTRFYDSPEGRITLDGHDISEVPRNALRRHVGAVFQHSYLFNTTLRENIRQGRLDATDAEVEEAARAAEIHDYITRLPEGYDTVPGEGGGQMSGGQRQRIALARAILRDPAILVLDEATSALDPATEAAVNATLERIS